MQLQSKNLLKMDEEIYEGNSVKISDLPQSVLKCILGKLSFGDAGKLRMVSKDFNEACSEILNAEFFRLKADIEDRYAKLKSKMPRRESLRKSHPLAHESEVVETLHLRIILLSISIGAHVQVKHCCFFPGEVLDECNKLIKIIDENGGRNTDDIMSEIFDLSVMAVEYFRSQIEPSLPALWHIPNTVENKIESLKKEFNTLSAPDGAVASFENWADCFISCKTAVYGNGKALRKLKKMAKSLDVEVDKLERKVSEVKHHEDCKVFIQENDMNDILQKIEHCESVLDSFESSPKRLKLNSSQSREGEGTSTCTSTALSDNK